MPVKDIIRKQIGKVISAFIEPQITEVIIRETVVEKPIYVQQPRSTSLPSTKNDPPIHRPADMNASMRRRWKSEGLPAFPQSTGGSYIIYKEGVTYYAINGMTGMVDFSATDASTVIQAAINAGREVFIKNGVYDISVSLLSVEGLRLTGEGYDTILRGTTIAPESIIKPASNNVEISNIRFMRTQIGYCIGRDAPFSVQYKNWNIHGCDFIGTVISGNPYCNSKTDSTISKAIVVDWGYDWNIHDNYFKWIGYEAVSSGAALITDAKYNEKVSFCNNIVELAGYGGVVFEGGTQNSICADNIIKAYAADGLSYGVYLMHRDTRNNIVSNNYISCQQHGILIYDSKRNNIEANTIITEQNGIYITGLFPNKVSRFNDINDNILYGNGATNYIGVFIDTDCYGNTIENNKIVNFWCGIQIKAIETDIMANTIKNALRAGIWVTAAGNARIKNNIINAADQLALIYLESTLGVQITGNTLIDTGATVSTTLNGNHASGVSVITVVDASVFDEGAFIQTQPTGFATENHQIKSIDYYGQTLTLQGVLANNHTTSDPVVGRLATEVGTRANTNVIIKNNFIQNLASPITNIGAGSTINNNLGYVTEDSGTATLLSGTTSIVVNLSGKIVNISGSPTGVVVTPITDITTISGTTYYAGSFNSGSFSILTSQSSPNSITFAYNAFYNP